MPAACPSSWANVVGGHVGANGLIRMSCFGDVGSSGHVEPKLGMKHASA